MENINLDGFRMVNIKPENALRERRVILGLTQQAVADRAQIPLQSYQQFESGKRKIRRASFEIACRVIEALEMTPTDFYHSEYLIGEEIYGSPLKRGGDLLPDSDFLVLGEKGSLDVDVGVL